MDILLSSVLLILFISVIFCDGNSLDPSPDVIEQCVNDDSSGANNASSVAFYHYVVDDDTTTTTTTSTGSNNRGVQYTICAANRTSYGFNIDTVTNAEANSICKINAVSMVLPEDSNEKCSVFVVYSTEGGEYVKFSSGSDCLDRYSNVIFKDWNEDEAN